MAHMIPGLQFSAIRAVNPWHAVPVPSFRCEPSIMTALRRKYKGQLSRLSYAVKMLSKSNGRLFNKYKTMRDDAIERLHSLREAINVEARKQCPVCSNTLSEAMRQQR